MSTISTRKRQRADTMGNELEVRREGNITTKPTENALVAREDAHEDRRHGQRQRVHAGQLLLLKNTNSRQSKQFTQSFQAVSNKYTPGNNQEISTRDFSRRYTIECFVAKKHHAE